MYVLNKLDHLLWKRAFQFYFGPFVVSLLSLFSVVFSSYGCHGLAMIYNSSTSVLAQ